MKYNKNYKRFSKTCPVKTRTRNTSDIRSFKISGERYEDTRRVVSRKFK